MNPSITFRTKKPAPVIPSETRWTPGFEFETASAKIGLALVLAFVQGSPAYANNPPEPPASLAVLSIPIIMWAMTAIGGGHAVINRLNAGASALKSAGSGLANGFAYLLFILFALSNEGGAILGALVFGLVAISRGVDMIRWSGRTSLPSDSPESLKFLRLNPVRLKAAGAAMIPIIILVALTPYFMTTSEGFFQRKRRRETLQAVCAMATELLTEAQAIAERGEKPDFANISKDETFLMSHDRVLARQKSVTLEITGGGTGFVVTMRPPYGMPPFPYNYLISKPIYRIDETGEVRRLMTHWADSECPPDAPVVLNLTQVQEDEIPWGDLTRTR